MVQDLRFEVEGVGLRVRDSLLSMRTPSKGSGHGRAVFTNQNFASIGAKVITNIISRSIPGICYYDYIRSMGPCTVGFCFLAPAVQGSLCIRAP